MKQQQTPEQIVPDAPWPSTYVPRTNVTHDEVVVDAIDIYTRLLNSWHYQSCLYFASPDRNHPQPVTPEGVREGIVRAPDFRIAMKGASTDEAYTWLLGEPVETPDGTLFVIRAYYGDDGGQHTLVVMCDEEYDEGFTRVTGWRINHITQHFDTNATIVYSAFDAKQNKAGVAFWHSIDV
jgi:hypothetical protein